MVNPAIRTADEFKSFISSFQRALSDKNQDLRTLGTLKALHTAAEGLGYSNWNQLLAVFRKSEFVEVLTSNYGLSDQYADAAWHTLSSTPSNQTLSGADLAKSYAARFNISPSNIEPAETEVDVRNESTIAGHTIRWYVNDVDGEPVTILDESSEEHIKKQVVEGFISGELCIGIYRADDDEEPIEARGWWEKQ